MLVDFSPLLKYRDFRLISIGQFISWFGSMLAFVALPYQIYHLTHSSFDVGMIGLVELIPLLFTALWGGALADNVDRKKLLLMTEFGLSLASLILFLNASLVAPHIWVLYFAAGLSSGLSGLHRPVLEAIGPQLVPKEDLPTLSALRSLQFGITSITGPALAGLIIAHCGLSCVYLIDFFTFFISLGTVFAIHTKLTYEKQTDPIFKSIHEGLKYTIKRQDLMGSYIIDIVAMIFGMPMALFPAMADKLGGVAILGWLYAAPSIGLLISSALSGWTKKIKRYGVAICISATVWGVAIIFFGLSSHIFWAVLFLAIAGAADSFSGIFRQTFWNETIPTNYRGRLAGISMISYMSGPLLGNAEAGFAAALVSVPFSIISGGVLCVAGVAICALALPKFWKFDSQESK